MSEVQPQPGDKVRVTSIVDKNGRYGGRASIEDGLFGATLEILERTDDPSRDLVGTTAEFDGVAWVKVEDNCWYAIANPRGANDNAMRGRAAGVLFPAPQPHKHNASLWWSTTATPNPTVARSGPPTGTRLAFAGKQEAGTTTVGQT